MKRLLFPLCLAALVAWSCSDDDDPVTTDGPVVTKDTGPTGDKTVQKDFPSMIDAVVGKDKTVTADMPAGKSYDMVIHQLMLPMTTTQSTAYALKVGGKDYNALGALLAAVQKAGTVKGIAEAVQNAVCRGDTLNLMRLTAPPKAGATVPATVVHSIGGIKKCCTSSVCITTKTPPVCNSGAITACFDGKGTFPVDTTKKTSKSSGNLVSGSKVQLTNDLLRVKMAFSGYNPLIIQIKKAVVRGNFTNSRITSGVIAGGVSKKDVETVIVPVMAGIINKLYTDPKTNTKTKVLLKTLFDANADGKITPPEVLANSLLKPLFVGDVDVDGDGTKEFSVGLGFNSVAGTITP